MPEHALEQNSKRTTILVALGLAALTFAVYLGTLRNGFVSYDDYDYIVTNPLVRGGLTWHGIVQAFTSIDQSNWFPLEWISLMGTSQWFGLNPAAYHFANLFLHTVNVVLLFLLLGAATGKTARSATVAALFAVFPLNVEAVAWATERKSVLSVFFLLLALAAYGWYVRKPQAGRYLLIVIPFALGLMTKAWLVTFPFALLLLDYWPLQRFGPLGDASEPGTGEQLSFGRLVVEKIPLLLMSFTSTAIGVYAARAGDALSISAAHAAMALRIENSLWSYFMYIAKGVWPPHLAIIYPFPQHYYPAWKIAFAVAFLLVATGLAWALRKQRYAIVGWLWYLGVLFPVIGLIQTGTQSMADRWAYISFLGLFVAAVWLAADSAEKIGLPRVAVTATGAAVIVAYAFIAFVQTGYWHDSFTLYTHALQVTSGNGPVRVDLGFEYENAGRPDLALPQYRQAVIDTPNLGIAHYDLARMLDDQHELQESSAEYRLAIANTGVRSEIIDAHIGLGRIYGEMNLPVQAVSEFSAALAEDSNDVYALLDRGMQEYKQGQLSAAETDFSRSVQITPTPMTWYTLGVILEGEQKKPEAIQAYQHALQINPNLREAQDHLAALKK